MAASPDPFLTVSDHWVPCSLGHITKVPGSVSSERCKQKRETDSVYLGAGTLCGAEGGERGGIVGKGIPGEGAAGAKARGGPDIWRNQVRERSSQGV